MSTIDSEFTFTTKSVPQMEGVGGAHWENLPLASFPPSLDISIPDSFGAALTSAVSNLASTFTGMSNTLTTVTQGLQNAACSVGSLVDSLKAAQKMAEDFAKENNNTKIFIRPIGLQPPGTITSQQIFLRDMREALKQTGSGAGQIPKIVPAEIPLDPKAIADALGSGGGLAENLLQGGKLSAGPVSVSFGAGLRTLSNDVLFKDGFPASSFATSIASIIRESDTSPEIKIVLKDSFFDNPNVLVGKKITITGTAANNGTFTITGFSDGSATQKLGGALGKVQSGISKLQQNLSPFIIKINNPNGRQQSKADGQVVVQLGNTTVPATVKVRTSLTTGGYLQSTPGARKTIPVTTLVDLLIKDKIIGSSADSGELTEAEPEVIAKDKNIAIERLARLASPNDKKVGGMVLIGQAPDLPALAAKVTALADMMSFLQPLATQLIQAVAEQSQKAALTPTGIYFDPALVNLAKLDASKNIGKLDADAAAKKAQDSGVLSFTMPSLVSLAKTNPQPAPNNFNAWRTYTPSDLFPLLGAVFGMEDELNVTSGANQFTSDVASATGAMFASTFGTLSQMIENGQNAVQNGLNTLQSKSKSIDGIVAELNSLNDKITAGINFIKNQLGKGPLKVDAHLIGAKLDLLSNADFADAVEASIKDIADPNRPTFGPPASNSVLDNQSNIISTAKGIAPTTRTNRLWFGIIIFIVGEGREDLGRQMRTMSSILGMDDSAIDLPPKTKFSFNPKF